MSSAEAPIIWSITNGSELMKNVPPPTAAAGNEMHVTTKAGIVQSNCSITNDIKISKYATANRKLPTVIARYLPNKESPIQPATGRSTNNATYAVDRKLFSTGLGKSSRVTFALTLPKAKAVSALHTRRSVVPRENGLQHLRSVIMLCSYLSSCGGNTRQNVQQLL